MPIASSNNLSIAGIQDIIEALNNPSTGSPIAPLTDNHVHSLRALTTILAGIIQPTPNKITSFDISQPTPNKTTSLPASPKPMHSPSPSSPSGPAPPPLVPALRVVPSPLAPLNAPALRVTLSKVQTNTTHLDTIPTFDNSTSLTGKC
jgi:hypothetical protein